MITLDHTTTLSMEKGRNYTAINDIYYIIRKCSRPGSGDGDENAYLNSYSLIAQIDEIFWALSIRWMKAVEGKMEMHNCL